MACHPRFRGAYSARPPATTLRPSRVTERTLTRSSSGPAYGVVRGNLSLGGLSTGLVAALTKAPRPKTDGLDIIICLGGISSLPSSSLPYPAEAILLFSGSSGNCVLLVRTGVVRLACPGLLRTGVDEGIVWAASLSQRDCVPQPRVAAWPLPWVPVPSRPSNPTGVASRCRCVGSWRGDRRNPRWGCAHGHGPSQGSGGTATLGYGPQPPWGIGRQSPSMALRALDSTKLHAKKYAVAG